MPFAAEEKCGPAMGDPAVLRTDRIGIGAAQQRCPHDWFVACLFEEFGVVGAIAQTGEDGQTRFVIELVTERGVVAFTDSQGEEP